MAKPCCERSEPTALKALRPRSGHGQAHCASPVRASSRGAMLRGCGERNPHQDFRGARNCRGQFLAAGENLALPENDSPPSCVFLRGRNIDIPLVHVKAIYKQVVTKWIQRKMQVVIKWLQMYPLYNHALRIEKIPRNLVLRDVILGGRLFFVRVLYLRRQFYRSTRNRCFIITVCQRNTCI